MSHRNKRSILTIAAICCTIIATIYIYASLVAHDEAEQARSQIVVDSVVRALQDSTHAEQALRQLLLEEQARTDSATQAETQIAAEAEKERKVDFLWKIYNQAGKEPTPNKQAQIFKQNATPHFQTYLKQRAPSLPQLLLFPLDNLPATTIWHFQEDWYAVSTPEYGSIVLRVIRQDNTLLIDDIQQATQPTQQDPLPQEEDTDY